MDPDDSRTAFTVRSLLGDQTGNRGHVRVQVFAGPVGGTRAQVGVLTLRKHEAARLLDAAAVYGAIVGGPGLVLPAEVSDVRAQLAASQDAVRTLAAKLRALAETDDGSLRPDRVDAAAVREVADELDPDRTLTD